MAWLLIYIANNTVIPAIDDAQITTIKAGIDGRSVGETRNQNHANR